MEDRARGHQARQLLGQLKRPAAACTDAGLFVSFEDTSLPVICPPDLPDKSGVQLQPPRLVETKRLRRPSMHSAAALPAVLYVLVYAAGEHEMSFLGAEMSRYGGPFCDHPHDVPAAAGLAAASNTFVGVADLQLKTENQTTGPGRGPDIF